MRQRLPSPFDPARRRGLAAVAVATLCVLGATAQAAPPSVVPLDVDVSVPPAAIRSGEMRHFLYEMRLSNFASREIALAQLDVVADDGRLLARFAAPDLAGMLAVPGQAAGTPSGRLAPGSFGTLFIEVQVPVDAAPPRVLSHRLSIAGPPDADPSRVQLDGPRVAVAPSSQVAVLGPPLKGGDWLVANGLSNDADHRRTQVVLDGQARIAQRYAIDLVKLDAGGRAFKADATQNAAWAGYAEPVLAVADGAVVSVRDQLPDNTPGQLPEGRISLDTIAGNAVILDIGQGRYVTYGHLIPGSVTVSPGQTVTKGQVIGKLGNSGQSDAPHLHLHVADAPSPLAAEGLPYTFECHRPRGTVTSLEAVMEGKPASRSSKDHAPRSDQLPVDNDVIAFCE